jgi:hypothetical protein
MAKTNSSGEDFSILTDGFSLGGGTTPRKITVTGADINITGSGTAVITFPSTSSTLQTLNLNETVTGAKTFTAGITGSLLGTASYATAALSSSYAATASVLLGSVVSASYAATASIATSASYAATASYVVNALTASYIVTAQTASYVLNAVSASFASTASLAPNYTTLTSFNSFTGSYRSGSFTGSFTGSLLGTASYATNALSSSYAGTASVLLGSVVSASYAATSSIATSSSYALTASFALNGGGGASTTKAGSGSVASFTGTPLISAITFGAAFADNNYSVTVTGEDARIFTIQSKSNTGFTINTNSNTVLSGPVYWIANPFA